MLTFDKKMLEDLQTPCLVIDLEKTVKNIKDMQEICDANQVKLRPHIKTHKMVKFAKLQMEHGACGISCAKLSEAEVMADAGIDDIFVAYPTVGKHRLLKAVALNRKVKRLILGVDSLVQAQALSEIAKKENMVFEIRMEIDTGANRCGVDVEGVVGLAKEISALENLKLTGIYTFKSLMYQGKATQEADLAADEEANLMKTVKSMIEEAGIGPLEISAGSTPTGIQLTKHNGIDEIRPGTYVFKDQMLVYEKVFPEEEISACVVATIVSIKNDGTIIVDGGSKAFCTDIGLNAAPYFYPGYAICEDRDYVLGRVNEEHGYLYTNSTTCKYKVGDQLIFYPIHICTTLNLYNEVYIFDGELFEKNKVDARGMVV